MKPNPTPQQTGPACAWLIHWQHIEPTLRRYQWAVCLDRVLADHHAALAAEPVHEVAR